MSHPNMGLSASLDACIRELHDRAPHADIPDKIMQATKDTVHEQVKSFFDTHAQQLQDAYAAANTSAYWHVWSACVTQGFDGAIRLLSGLRTGAGGNLPTFSHIGRPIFQKKAPVPKSDCGQASHNQSPPRPQDHRPDFYKFVGSRTILAS